MWARPTANHPRYGSATDRPDSRYRESPDSASLRLRVVVCLLPPPRPASLAAVRLNRMCSREPASKEPLAPTATSPLVQEVACAPRELKHEAIARFAPHA